MHGNYKNLSLLWKTFLILRKFYIKLTIKKVRKIMCNYLNEVNSPDDIKKLNIDEMEELAQEIREFLIKSISKTGGHLASNLGVVELTLALHKVFDSPKDKLLQDVKMNLQH